MASPDRHPSTSVRGPSRLLISSTTPGTSFEHILEDAIDKTGRDFNAWTNIEAQIFTQQAHLNNHKNVVEDSGCHDLTNPVESLTNIAKATKEVSQQEPLADSMGQSLDKISQDGDNTAISAAKSVILSMIKVVPGFHRAMVEMFDEDFTTKYWSEFQQYLKDIKDSKTELQSLAAKFTVNSTAVHNLRKQVSHTFAANQETIRRKDAYIHELQSTVDEFSLASSKMSTELVEQRRMLQTLECKPHQLLQTNKSLSEDYEQVKQDFSDLQIQTSAQDAKLAECDATIRRLKEEVSASVKKATATAALQDSSTESSNQLASYQVRNTEFRNTIRSSMSWVVAYDVRRQRHLSDLESLQDSVHGPMDYYLGMHLQNYVDDLRRWGLDTHEVIEEDHQALPKLLQNMHFRAEKSQNHIVNLIKHANTEIESFRKHQREEAIEMKRVMANGLDMVTRVGRAEAACDTRIRERDEIHRQGMLQLSNRYIEKVRSLEAQNSRFAEELSQLRNEVDQKNNLISVLEAKHIGDKDNCNAKVAGLESEVTQLNTHITKENTLQAQLYNTEAENTILTAQLNEARINELESGKQLRSAQYECAMLKHSDHRWMEVVFHYLIGQHTWEHHKAQFTIKAIFDKAQEMLDARCLVPIGVSTFHDLIQEPSEIDVIDPIVATLKVWFDCKGTFAGPSYKLVLSLANAMKSITSSNIISVCVSVIIDAVTFRWNEHSTEHRHWDADQCMAWLLLVVLLVLYHRDRQSQQHMADISQMLRKIDFSTGIKESILVASVLRYLKGAFGIEFPSRLADSAVAVAKAKNQILPDHSDDARFIPMNGSLLLAMKTGSVRIVRPTDFAIFIDASTKYRLVVNNFPKEGVSGEVHFPTMHGESIKSMMLQAVLRGIIGNPGFIRI